jgi:putative hydroxymethylpyrimidine transport system permease protein
MKMAMSVLRPVITLAGFVVMWWACTVLTSIPSYMLPGPGLVWVALWEHKELLFNSMLTTLGEILVGLAAGTVLGAICSLAMVYSRALQRWLMPLLVLSQAIPVFALAPLLVLWFGFGIMSKIVVTVLIIFFPVTAAFFDGLRSANSGWLDLAKTMNASPFAILYRVRLPAALPAFGSGLRVATAITPIGAIMGEWVGSSAGLGHVMQNSNARIETDLMFAALLVLSAMAVALYFAVDQLIRWALYWHQETLPSGE